MNYVYMLAFTIFEALIAWSILMMAIVTLSFVQVKCLKRLRVAYLHEKIALKSDNDYQRNLISAFNDAQKK